jgi:hypothetical protein
MAVIARSAATEGGRASGECMLRERRSHFSDWPLPYRRSLLACDRFRSCALSWLPRIGITTGEDGVVVVGFEMISAALVEGISLRSCLESNFDFLSSTGRSYLTSLLLAELGFCRVKRKLLGWSIVTAFWSRVPRAADPRLLMT